MKIVKELPPNYSVVKLKFPYKEGTIYTYGDTIYNKSGKEIPEDIIYHESIHSKRQKDPDQWWYSYLMDEDFRREEELFAYAHQYLIVQKSYPSKLQKGALEEFANNLSSMYNLDISKHSAETQIRHKARLLAREKQNAKE